MGKKLGPQAGSRPLPGTALHKSALDSSKDPPRGVSALGNKENDKNLVNRPKVTGFSEKPDTRQITNPGVYATYTRDKSSSGLNAAQGLHKMVSKPAGQQTGANPFRSEPGWAVRPEMPARRDGSVDNPQSSGVLAKDLVARTAPATNSRTPTEGRPFWNQDSSDGQIPDSARDRNRANDSMHSGKFEDMVLSTRDRIGQVNLGQNPKGGDSSVSKEQIINLYEGHPKLRDGTGSLSVKTLRSNSYRTPAREASPNPPQQHLSSLQKGELEASEVRSNSREVNVAKAARFNTSVVTSAFRTEDISAPVIEETKPMYLGSSKKVLNNSRGYLMDSLKKGTAALDSGLKRTRSQLKMDDLREIFEDDSKFIESTKKTPPGNDFSFSEEKKKSILVERFEVGSENARKLDFNGLENINQGFNATGMTKNSILQDYNAEVRKGIGVFNIEKLKIQKRPEGSVDFNAIKNNLRARRLGTGTPTADPQSKNKQDSIFFGNLTLVANVPEQQRTPRNQEATQPMRKFKSNAKLTGAPGRSDRQLFNKTADGKFIQQELALVEEEVRPEFDDQPRQGVPLLQGRHNSSGLVEHGWFHRMQTQSNILAGGSHKTCASPPSDWTVGQANYVATDLHSPSSPGLRQLINTRPEILSTNFDLEQNLSVLSELLRTIRSGGQEYQKLREISSKLLKGHQSAIPRLQTVSSM